MIPNLNWREWQHIAQAISKKIDGHFVERVLVPERLEFPTGSIKNEWIFRFHDRSAEHYLCIGLRGRGAYFYLGQGRGPKPAPDAAQSAFIQNLNKNLKGAKLDRLEAVPRERTLQMHFAPSGQEPLTLILTLIPSAPEGALVRTHDYSLVSHSKLVDVSKALRVELPDGIKAPENPPFRPEIVGSLEIYKNQVENALSEEALQQRVQRARKILNEESKIHLKRIHEMQEALKRIQSDPDWMKFGNSLKAALHELPQLTSDGHRLLVDYDENQEILVPCDPRLTPQKQIEKFYALAKRKARRTEESATRLAHAQEAIQVLEPTRKLLDQLSGEDRWKIIQSIEKNLGIAATSTEGGRKPHARPTVGKRFESKEGWAIWVGRSKDENLELTFKFAKGNDLWMHVRGRPGAHVVIPVPAKKSPSLETILDGAALAIQYSGGQTWGKTEVDYTFKKYVKRIKDSSEASYAHNKTLIVSPDPIRLKRLLGS